MVARLADDDQPSAVDAEREAWRMWRQAWIFGIPVDAPAAGVMLRWRDGLHVIETEIGDAAERVEAARRLAHGLGLGEAFERWIARPRWSPS
jgi:hypothetical protein